MDEYIRLVNKSEDYIESHLSEKISLDDLANNVNMSKYHFHRILSTYCNETVKQFVTRVKLERIGIFLTVHDDLNITDIALQYGYNDASTFNKAFKKHFGMSPLAYKKARNDKKQRTASPILTLKEMSMMEKPTITVENIEMKVIYVRFKGNYMAYRKNSRKMFHELFKFAKKYDLINENTTKVMTLYHDNPFITDSDNLRTSVAMTIPLDCIIEEEGQIGTMTFGGKYAVLHYNLTLGEYEEAWEYAYSDLLLNNDAYTLRDSFPFELYVTEPPKNFKTKSMTNIYMPIE